MKRYVLTGGPCCGKTSLVNELRQRGISILDEAAREVLEEKRLKPGTADFQLEVFNRQLLKEQQNNSNELLLDRGGLDCVAYSKYFLNSVPRRIREFDFADYYSKIFVLDRLPFQDDGVRIESGEQEAELIHNLLIKTYRQQGYSPISVPVIPIKQRADFILQNVRN